MSALSGLSGQPASAVEVTGGRQNRVASKMVLVTEYAPQGLDGGVTITTAAPSAPAGFVFPTTAELRKLAKLVYGLRPDLASDESDQHSLRFEFGRAFLALSWLGRRSDVDHGKAISYWCEHARDLLRNGGMEAQIPPNILVAAALAHGDIAHAKSALGLTRANTGAPATGAWRGVLKSGALLPASAEQATCSIYEPSRVRVYELAMPVGTMPTGTR